MRDKIARAKVNIFLNSATLKISTTNDDNRRTKSLLNLRNDFLKITLINFNKKTGK